MWCGAYQRGRLSLLLGTVRQQQQHQPIFHSIFSTISSQRWFSSPDKDGSSPSPVTVETTKSSSTRRRRRQTRAGAPTAETIPSYKEFVHKFTVIRLYRNFLKTVRDMPHNQDDLKQQVQREFAANKTLLDSAHIQRELGEGQRKLAELQDFTGRTQPGADSWIHIQDEDDQRGRVGTGWPWSK
jgi:hypothetical protein